MDPLRLAVALGPLALYLLSIGLLNVGAWPRVVSGGRDLAALGVGVAGLFVVGPIELLMPYAAAYTFGPFVWCVLLTLYSLTLSLVVLLTRPRLVVYNACTLSELRPALAAVLARIDPEARWAGNCVSLPTLQVDLSVEYYGPLRSITLSATHDHQSLEGWSRLHGTLAAELRSQAATTTRRANPWGAGLVVSGLALLIVVGWQLGQHPQAVTQALDDMLRW